MLSIFFFGKSCQVRIRRAKISERNWLTMMNHICYLREDIPQEASCGFFLHAHTVACSRRHSWRLKKQQLSSRINWATFRSWKTCLHYSQQKVSNKYWKKERAEADDIDRILWNTLSIPGLKFMRNINHLHAWDDVSFIKWRVCLDPLTGDVDHVEALQIDNRKDFCERFMGSLMQM